MRWRIGRPRNGGPGEPTWCEVVAAVAAQDRPAEERFEESVRVVAAAAAVEQPGIKSGISLGPAPVLALGLPEARQLGQVGAAIYAEMGNRTDSNQALLTCLPATSNTTCGVLRRHRVNTLQFSLEVEAEL